MDALISVLRRRQDGWAARLLLLGIVAGLMLGTALRSVSHEHGDMGFAAAHHASQAHDHPVPDAPDDDQAGSSTHYHYAATLVFVAPVAALDAPAGVRQLGLICLPEYLAPMCLDGEKLHRPPIV